MNKIPRYTAYTSLRAPARRSSGVQTLAARGQVIPAFDGGFDPCTYCWGRCAQFCLLHPGSYLCQNCINMCVHIFAAGMAEFRTT